MPFQFQAVVLLYMKDMQLYVQESKRQSVTRTARLSSMRLLKSEGCRIAQFFVLCPVLFLMCCSALKEVSHTSWSKSTCSRIPPTCT